MRILLVGAGGFIGRHLHAALRAAGHRVLASARRPDPVAPGEWCRLDLAELARDPDRPPMPGGTWPGGSGSVARRSASSW